MRWVQLPTSPFRRALCIFVETGLLAGAFMAALLAARVFFGATAEESGYALFFPKLVLATGVFQLSLYYVDLYDEYTTPARMEMLLRLTRAFFMGTVVVALVFYAFPIARFGRGIVVFYIPLALAGIFGWRVACLRLWGHEALRETVLILGTGLSAQQLAREVLERARLDFRVAGFVGEQMSDPSVIGTLADLRAVVEREKANLVVVALEDLRGHLPVAELLRLRMAGVRIEDAATFFERVTGKILLRDLRPSWFVFSQGFNHPRWFEKTKQLVEVTMAGLALVVSSPLLVVLAAILKLDSRGPVLYGQERVGLRGRLFKLYKLRTMQEDAEAATGPVWSRRDGDPRVTRLGRLFRKLRLDEVPQLWNVVKGEMSFVGPRPERPHFVEQLRTVIPYYDERHTVKPGITGWAQVKYGYGSNLEDAEEKLQYDLYYVKHMTALFDVQIVLHTVKVMLLGRGAR